MIILSVGESTARSGDRRYLPSIAPTHLSTPAHSAQRAPQFESVEWMSELMRSASREVDVCYLHCYVTSVPHTQLLQSYQETRYYRPDVIASAKREQLGL